MAVSWNIQDDFIGATTDGLLQDRTANTGQQWGTLIDTPVFGEVPAGRYPNYVKTRPGKAFVNVPPAEAGVWASADPHRTILFMNDGYNPHTTNIYEWTLNRFPEYGAPGTAGSTYRKTEALLAFDSRFTAPFSGNIAPENLRCVRLAYDWNNNKVLVSSPYYYGTTLSETYNFLEWFEPLPLLTSSEHPDTYTVRLTTRGEEGMDGYWHTLTINGITVYEDYEQEYYSGAMGGCGIGFKTGGTSTARIYSTLGTVELIDFRAAFDVRPDATPIPFRQIGRFDGLNASGQYQLNRQGIGSGGLWQISGR